MDYEHTKLRELNKLMEGAAAKAEYILKGASHASEGVRSNANMSCTLSAKRFAGR